MDKSGAAAHAEKPSAGHGDKAAHGDKSAHAPTAAPAAAGGATIPADEAKRVGSFAAIAGWAFGLIAGIVITALIGARPAWLFGVVGVPIVLASYLFGTFAGGRIARTYLRNFIRP